jgi:biotin-(acetyl-CoA carboxylase) ligase
LSTRYLDGLITLECVTAVAVAVAAIAVDVARWKWKNDIVQRPFVE